MEIPAWLKAWLYLQNHDPGTLTEVARGADISFAYVRAALGVLDTIGLINMKCDGRAVRVYKTQKFYDTLELFQEVCDAVELAHK